MISFTKLMGDVVENPAREVIQQNALNVAKPRFLERVHLACAAIEYCRKPSEKGARPRTSSIPRCDWQQVSRRWWMRTLQRAGKRTWSLEHCDDYGS